ncbi:MAG: ERCC4 domain-containing protein [Thermosphaera sp.]
MSFSLLFPVDVIIDSKEDSKHPDAKKKLLSAGLKVAVLNLPAGDFLLLSPPDKQSILVERKTVDDFANSIRDNRIWEQAKLLKNAAAQDGHKPLIILEGCIEDLARYRGWKPQSLLRILDTLILEFEIPVLNTPGFEETVQWIVLKAKSLGETGGKKVFRMKVEKKPLSINERILYVAESLAGPATARKLLRSFKTLKNLANASISELLRVEGVGEKRAEEIFLIFNTEWRESNGTG